MFYYFNHRLLDMKDKHLQTFILYWDWVSFYYKFHTSSLISSKCTNIFHKHVLGSEWLQIMALDMQLFLNYIVLRTLVFLSTWFMKYSNCTLYICTLFLFNKQLKLSKTWLCNNFNIKPVIIVILCYKHRSSVWSYRSQKK